MAAGQPFVPTIGVPFTAIQMSSGDGSVLTVTITVNDAAGRFSTTVDNSSVRATPIVYYDPLPTRVSVPAGQTVFASSGARRWPVSMSFSSA